MKYETIEIQRKNNIVTIILNRPEVHNAMNEKLMKELTSCFEKLNKENQTRIIILTGKGKIILSRCRFKLDEKYG